MSNNQPLISIIIVNWNGLKWLDGCLKSIFSQTYTNFEVIFVDNDSSDDSVKFVNENFPKIMIVQTGSNLGFAGGNNFGLIYARGQYILLLNNDTYVTENYLAEFIKAFYLFPNAGAIQSKILLMKKPDKLDVCGSFWTDSSFLYHYGYGQDQSLEQFNKSMPVFSNKGASMMMRKDVIDKVGFLDNDFWSYYEETDLCNRIWLAGYECWYYPGAIMYHAMGGTALTLPNSYIQFHNFKNKLLSFLKNFEIWTLIKILPAFIFLNIVLSFYWLFQGKLRHFVVFYRAVWWNVNNFQMTLKKRRVIQALRTKKDKEIFKTVKKNPKIRYYYYLLMGLEKYEERV